MMLLFNTYMDLSDSVIHSNIIGLSEMVENLIECCHIDSCPYHEQSLVIFEHTSQEVVSSDSSKLSQNSATTTNSSKLSLTNYFDYCNVIRMVVIERPRDKFQLYVSEDLGEQFHFSCPTASVPRLYHSIKAKNFKDLKLLFIPRTCEEYVSEKLFVCNHWNNQPKNITNHEYLSKVIESSAVNTTSSKKSNAMKRSNKSVSIALQTMYSHQQHKARYCMLPHSVPFVPTIKNHCVEVRGSIISAYSFCCEVLSSSAASNDGKHPFSTDMIGGSTDEEKRVRLSLRSDLLKKLLRDDLDENVNPDIMFEACTMQQTGMLGFHRDTMNCPYLDKTIALHVPDSNNCDSCLSFLYYSRKCVGDYAQKRKAINTFINNPESCPLTVLCLKSLLEVDGIFNYQGLLFENEECLNDLAERYEKSSKHSCAEVSSFTGLSCFKHGAAFDKMGYYSIFVDVYLTLFYLKLVSNDDDSISLCIYFGLLCNGTSNLAATLKDVYNNIDFAQEWCSKKKDRTRLFRLLVILEKRRRSKDSRSDMYGSCKLPRFQYANYSSSVIEEADMVHCYVKDFLMQHSTSSKTDKRINSQHAELYKTLSSIKGIGPLSFNQFWHSLCLCGLLPMDCVQATAVAAGSGPAKLIQTYYPGCKSPEALLSKLHEVKSAINSLGINRISDFFLENMMCELWRLGSKSKLATKSMKPEERKIGFLSDEFHRALVDSAPTKNPDIYYLNPFTDEYQHLFRVVDKQLTMRPSFLPNNNGSSSVVRCVISHCTETGETTVEWSGDFFRRGERSARECFV